jgi:hypothetical protein
MTTQLQEIAQLSDHVSFVTSEIDIIKVKLNYQRKRLTTCYLMDNSDSYEIENIQIKIEGYLIQIETLEEEKQKLITKTHNLIQNN